MAVHHIIMKVISGYLTRNFPSPSKTSSKSLINLLESSSRPRSFNCQFGVFLMLPNLISLRFSVSQLIIVSFITATTMNQQREYDCERREIRNFLRLNWAPCENKKRAVERKSRRHKTRKKFYFCATLDRKLWNCFWATNGFLMKNLWVTRRATPKSISRGLNFSR